MSLLKVKSTVGIDMDAYEIRAAEIGGTAEKPSLLGLGRAALPEGVVREGKVSRPEGLQEALIKLWQDSKFKSRNVILGVSNQDVLLRFALIPKAPADKLDNFIRFQAQDFLPIPVNDVELDYIVLGETQYEKQSMLKVLLVAGRRNMLDGFTQAVAGAGLRLMDIDVSILALARLIQENDKSVAVINHTREQVSLIILDKGQPAFARILSVNPAGQARESIYAGRAESEAAAGDEDSAGEAAIGILKDNIVAEIRSSITYFQTQNPGSFVEKCIVSYGSSAGTNVRSKLGERLGINVEIIDPIKGLNMYHLSGNNPFGRASDFSVSISLALRGLEGNRA